MRYFVKFSYDGSCFNGFQKQVGFKTVQGVFEAALFSLCFSEISLCASGRTDKGVHARCQCAHFDLPKEIKPYNLKKYLNNHFNGEIYIFECCIVNDSFHARYDVVSKEYGYYINMGDFDPCLRNYMLQLGKQLDVSLMKEASLCLIGEHDFRSFCTDEKNKENCVRKIYDISFDVSYNVLKISFVGNGFLRKMIRNIVAIMIEIGTCQKDVSYMKEVLDKNSRSGNLKCVSGCALYLEDVSYK